MKRLIMAVVAMAAGMGMLAGCGTNDSGTTGTLKVAITDKMSADCASVVVTVKEIRAVPAGRENSPDDSSGLPVIVRFATPQVIDVMKLQFKAELLGEAVIPAGSYTQLRLILADNPNGNQAPVNYLTLKTATTVKLPLTTPSAQQSGLKILGPFTVMPNQVTAMMIDFDPNTAIVVRGNGDYNLKPTGIRLVKMDSMMLANYGTIAGMIRTTAPMSSIDGTFIAVKQYGTSMTVASGAVFGSYSAPFTAFVPAGDYRVHVTSPGFLPYSTPKTSVAAGPGYTTLADILLKLP